MTLKIVTEPTKEPLSISDVKEHLNITSTDDDAYLRSLITVARVQVEKITNRAMLTQTWDLWLDSFPSKFTLPYAPLQSVTSITYTDTNGDSQTVTSSVYTADTNEEPAEVFLAYQQTWPSTRDIPNAVKIRFIAGYTSASLIPMPLKHAIYLMIGHMYENREATIAGGLAELPLGVDQLLGSYRIWNQTSASW